MGVGFLPSESGSVWPEVRATPEFGTPKSLERPSPTDEVRPLSGYRA